MSSFAPDRCDLCGCSNAREELRLSGRCMTSDSRILSGDLIKLQCLGCGLVRAGATVDEAALEEHYGSDYRLAAAARGGEPINYAEPAGVARSAALGRWIGQAWAQVRGDEVPRQVLEIGCGEGRVVEALSRMWPGSQVRGLEPNAEAVALAQARGLAVDRGIFERATGQHDLILSIAVIEHVPSPRRFLGYLRDCLAPGGMMIVVLPCLDALSHDIMFVDHLHHFHGNQISALGSLVGLTERRRLFPNPLLPHFMLLAFESCTPDETAVRALAPDARIGACTELWQRRFAALDDWLGKTTGRPLHVWGLGEQFTLLQAYSRLGTTEVVSGLDDNIARHNNITHGFSVARPGERSLEGGRLLVTFLPSPAVRDRIEALGVPWFSHLSD